MSCCVRANIILKSTGGKKKKTDLPSLSLKLCWIWLRDGRVAGIHMWKGKCYAWQEGGEGEKREKSHFRME